MKPKFFKNGAEFRKWLQKNHESSTELWVGLQKGGIGMTQKEALDQALCFGWIYGVIKRIDDFSYKIRYVKRKPKSTWSSTNLKRAYELKKLGLMKPAGLKALMGRDKEKSEERPTELTLKHLKLFKANRVAWEFFSNMRASYKRYMIWWVNGAKREETQLKRLTMLIEDSGKKQRLRRLIEAEKKLAPKYEPGKTPIEAARNIGPLTASELKNVGIKTVEQLRSMGWERAFQVLCEVYPHRINLNMLNGIIGAVEDIDWRKLDPHLRAEAKALLVDMKRTYRF